MFLKDQSIRKKMVVSSLLITMIPLLILECVFLVLLQRESVKALANSAAAFADQLEDNYQNELDKLERIAQTLTNFSPLENYLSLEFEGEGEAFSYYLENVHPMLTSCNNVYAGVRVRVYHDLDQVQNFSFELNNDLTGFMKQYISKDAYLGEKGFWFYSGIRYNTYESVFSYCLPVRRSTWPHDILYVVSIHTDENFFYTQISNEPPDSRMVFITDKDGDILSSNQRDAAGASALELSEEEQFLLKHSKDRERVIINDREYFLLRRGTEELNIFYLADYDSIYSIQDISIVLLITLGSTLLLISFILVMRVSQSITKSIEKLKQKMVNIDRENIHELAAYDLNRNSKDEIMQLDIVFTSMMGQIDILMDRIQLQERKLKDEVITRQQAEIRALQHQIDPHYLFNTLEAIRMNLITKNDRENAEIIKLFAESFRRYVDMRDEYVSLFEEVEFVRKYIDIQNYRLNDKIQFICIAEQIVLRYRIKKLLLQPLVENAVCHGIEQKADGGKVILRIVKADEYLQISVEDDGVGMKKEELEKLRAMVYSDRPESSVGLHNVYQRVRLIYGERTKMIIESIEGMGTRVQLLLPSDILEESECFES